MNKMGLILRYMHNKLRNRKAVSALVATVLLILITVAAIGIIWGAIMPMLNKATQLGQACMNARLMVDTTSGYTCYYENRKQVSVMITRGAEEFELIGMQLGIREEAMKKSYIIKEEPSLILSLNLEEGEGNITHDASGKKNDAVILGANWTEGIFGSALDFDGVDDSALIKTSKTLDLEDEVTIEMWIKIDNVENFTLANFIIARDINTTELT